MKRSYTNDLQVIPASIYPCNIYVFRGATYSGIEEHLKEIDTQLLTLIKKEYFNNPGYTFCTSAGDIVILLRNDYVKNVSIITHECFHAVEFIMDIIGCPLNENSSEPYAYLLGYLTDLIFNYDN